MLEKIIQFFNGTPSRKALNNLKELEVELEGFTDLTKLSLAISRKEEDVEEIKRACYSGEISKEEVRAAVAKMLRKNVFNFAQRKYDQWLYATCNEDPNCYLDQIVGKNYMSYALANGCFNIIERTAIRAKERESWKVYVKRNPHNDVLEMVGTLTDFILNYQGKNQSQLN